MKKVFTFLSNISKGAAFPDLQLGVSRLSESSSVVYIVTLWEGNVYVLNNPRYNQQPEFRLQLVAPLWPTKIKSSSVHVI